MYITSRSQLLAQEKPATTRRSPLASPKPPRQLSKRTWTPSQPVAPPGDVLPTLLPSAERDISWAGFCEPYFAATPRSSVRDGFNTFDERFRRIYKSERLMDVNEDFLSRLVDAMLAEGRTPDGLRRRFSCFRAALKWGMDVGLVDPSLFDVHRVPVPRSMASPVAGYCWQWRALDGRPNYRLVRESAT